MDDYFVSNLYKIVQPLHYSIVFHLLGSTIDSYRQLQTYVHVPWNI